MRPLLDTATRSDFFRPGARCCRGRKSFEFAPPTRMATSNSAPRPPGPPGVHAEARARSPPLLLRRRVLLLLVPACLILLQGGGGGCK